MTCGTDLSLTGMMRDAAEKLLSVHMANDRPARLDTPVANGIALDREVLPGLEISAHDLIWLSDGNSEGKAQPSLHCGFLLAGESAPLHVEGGDTVAYPVGRAVVTGFPSPMRCSRPWKAGTRSYVAGFTMKPEFLDRFGPDIERDGLASLRSFGEEAFRHALLPRSPGLREIARSFLENPYGGDIATLLVEANALRFLAETVT